jgi:hypothetical protein
LELNGLRQILIYADDGNVLGEEQTMFWVLYPVK